MPTSGHEHKKDVFHRFSALAARGVGTSGAFLLALSTVLVWAGSGPLFGFSEDWQLVINTGTTIVTFLMVFLIQNAQNRDSKEIHLKLDELIRSVEGARNRLVDLEDCTDEELGQLQAEFRRLRLAQEAISDSPPAVVVRVEGAPGGAEERTEERSEPG